MKQKGFILIVSLIFLVIMTMLGISMFSGVTLDERMSGNQREKSRSIDAAQLSLNAAEYWLQNSPTVMLGGSLNPGVVCNLSVTQTVPCTNSLTDPVNSAGYSPLNPYGLNSQLGWKTAALNLSTAIPSLNSGIAASQVSATGGLDPNGNPYYASQPLVYIQFLGYVPGSTTNGYYQVTAAAQGGNGTATTVVQAVYRVSPKATCPTCTPLG